MSKTSETLTRTRKRAGGKPLSPADLARFLEVLELVGVVTDAARASKVSRAALYKRRKADPDFAQAWDKAEAIGAGPLGDGLEAEAIRRAMIGTHRPMSVGGKLVRVREFSDTLLMFLLKAKRRGVYGDKVDVGGKVALSFKIDLGDDKE